MNFRRGRSETRKSRAPDWIEVKNRQHATMNGLMEVSPDRCRAEFRNNEREIK